MVNEEIEFLECDISVELSMPLVVHVDTDIAAFADAYNEVVFLPLLPDLQSGLQRHPGYENIVDKVMDTVFVYFFFFFGFGGNVFLYILINTDTF